MADLAVNTVPVRVVRDTANVFTPTNSPVRQVDCSAMKLATEHLYVATVEEAGCMTRQEGEVAKFPTPDTIATVKMKTEQGDIWIVEADYPAWVDGCNACCNP